jgi:mRNA-degrading endonuclease RelE of RelBE toxin-antitoxin system
MARYAVVLKQSAVADLDTLRKYTATQILDAIERHLQDNPTRESKSRIKKLRGVSNPDYRLRVGDYRVFFIVDAAARRVEILRVMHKDQTLSYYEELTR